MLKDENSKLIDMYNLKMREFEEKSLFSFKKFCLLKNNKE